MSSDVKITYVNRSLNMSEPKIFLFAKNEIPTFDSLQNGIAWKVIEKVGRGSSCVFPYPEETKICASWDDGTCFTDMLPAECGRSYNITMNETGIVLLEGENAGNSRSLDVRSEIHTPGGLSVSLYKDGRVLASENIVAYNQKATFIVNSKLYWGIASEIQEGEQVSSAVLNSTSFFEQDLIGVSEVTVALHGNAEEGYRFEIESQR